MKLQDLNPKDRLDRIITLLEDIGPGDGFTEDVGLSIEDGVETLQKILDYTTTGKSLEEVLETYNKDKDQYLAHAAKTIKNLSVLIKGLIDTGVAKQIVQMNKEMSNS